MVFVGGQGKAMGSTTLLFGFKQKEGALLPSSSCASHSVITTATMCKRQGDRMLMPSPGREAAATCPGGGTREGQEKAPRRKVSSLCC